MRSRIEFKCWQIIHGEYTVISTKQRSERDSMITVIKEMRENDRLKNYAEEKKKRQAKNITRRSLPRHHFSTICCALLFDNVVRCGAEVLAQLKPSTVNYVMEWAHGTFETARHTSSRRCHFCGCAFVWAVIARCFSKYFNYDERSWTVTWCRAHSFTLIRSNHFSERIFQSWLPIEHFSPFYSTSSSVMLFACQHYLTIVSKFAIDQQ